MWLWIKLLAWLSLVFTLITVEEVRAAALLLVLLWGIGAVFSSLLGGKVGRLLLVGLVLGALWGCKEE